MLENILFSILFFLPAGIANSTPVVAAKISWLKALDIPVDGGRSFRGVRIFGDHKTIRGFITGTFTAVVVTYIIQQLFIHSSYIQFVSPVDYSTINPFVLGALLGLGALAGDAIKSFFKRRTSIPPGKSWFPFDQLDYIVGGLLLSSVYVKLPFQYYITITLVWFGLHLLFTYIAYLFRLKQDPI